MSERIARRVLDHASLRNVIGDVLSRAVQDAAAVAFAPFSPFLGIGPDSPSSRPRACYRVASGAMVHVKPECRCPR
jgi:hypothetical protein